MSHYGWKYRCYANDRDDEKSSRFGLFIENLVCVFMAFTTCIADWLGHFGMNVVRMLGLPATISAIIALTVCRTK
jgi:hypothetical protein